MMFAFYLGLLWAAVSTAAAHISTPALIWTNTGAKDLIAPSALGEVSLESFYDDYLSKLHPNVILFLQKSLSVEDIASYSGFLSTESKHPIYVPSLKNPYQLEDFLLNKTYKAHSLHTLDGAGPDEKSVTVVYLNQDGTSLSRQQVMQESEKVIAHVLKDKNVQARKSTFVFTGLKSSIEEASEPQPRERRAADGEDPATTTTTTTSTTPSPSPSPSPSPTPNLHSNACVMMYFRNDMNLSLTGKAGSFVALPESTSTTLSGSCGTDSESLGLKYTGVTIGGAASDVTVVFEFSKTQGWRAPRAVVTIGSNPNNTLLLQGDQMASSIPVGLSFSCTPSYVYRAAKQTGSADRVTLQINGVQMQAFLANSTGSFGQYWDCVGFFTPGIWMGLLSAALGLLILSYGFFMIATITTMDRFDDPRGKCITVQQED